MDENTALDTYWISFPNDPGCPFGIGVTARSYEDAFDLIRQQGIDGWYAHACEINIRRGIRIADLPQSNVVPNIGPMQFRGVWYPATNIGWGAPAGAEYTRLRDDEK